jgi:hypothetical protein
MAAFMLSPPEGSHWMCGAIVWFIIALPLSLTGLGLIASRYLAKRSIAPELLPILGLAAFTLGGGALNLAHMAFPASIWALLGIGLFALARQTLPQAARESRSGVWHAFRADPEVLLLGLIVVGVMALTMSSQLAPRVFNWRDDLQKYFAHPVRMLETGTLFGSPLSAIGIETLGGVAFVHAASMLWLPLQAINGADAVLGLFLCLLPLFALGARNRALRGVAAVAIASVIIIDPYYVNVSALFLGSALIMAAVILTSDPGDDAASPAVMGLIYSALVALKPTFLLFAAPHIVCVALTMALGSRGPGRGLAWGAKAVAWSALFLSPWILLHLPHYLAPAAPQGPQVVGIFHNSIDLFGVGPMPMGLTGLRAYTVLSAALVALAIVCARVGFGGRARDTRHLGVAVAAIVTAGAYPTMIFLFPRIVGYADADSEAVRYFIPLAIAVFPLTLCAAAQALGEAELQMPSHLRVGICLSLGLAALVPFSGTASERYRDASAFGTFMPFPVAHEQGLADEMKYALSRAKQADVADVQDRIPAGASLIAWINTPYFLDYSRNTIYDAEVAGISNRWAVPPPSDYILWEYRGSASPQERTRKLVETLPAMNSRRAGPLIEFDKTLWARVTAGTVVFKNEEFLLVRAGGAPR